MEQTTNQGMLAHKLREKVDEHKALWGQHTESMGHFLEAVRSECLTEAQIFSDSLDALTDEMREVLAQAQMAELALVRAMKEEKAKMLVVMEKLDDTDLEGTV
jgi:flavorubredoxin